VPSTFFRYDAPGPKLTCFCLEAHGGDRREPNKRHEKARHAHNGQHYTCDIVDPRIVGAKQGD
jgi:hypothetical protein